MSECLISETGLLKAPNNNIESALSESRLSGETNPSLVLVDGVLEI